MGLMVYGIKNCNTVKSALAWLKDHGIDFEFYDLKAKGIEQKKLKQWAAAAGWEKLLNRRGATWRQLPPEVQEKIANEAAALQLMKEKTSVIKRPVIEQDDQLLTIGFDEDEFSMRYL